MFNPCCPRRWWSIIRHLAMSFKSLFPLQGWKENVQKVIDAPQDFDSGSLEFSKVRALYESYSYSTVLSSQKNITLLPPLLLRSGISSWGQRVSVAQRRSNDYYLQQLLRWCIHGSCGRDEEDQRQGPCHYKFSARSWPVVVQRTTWEEACRKRLLFGLSLSLENDHAVQEVGGVGVIWRFMRSTTILERNWNEKTKSEGCNAQQLIVMQQHAAQASGWTILGTRGAAP